MADDLLQGVQDGMDSIPSDDGAEGLPNMPGMGDFKMPSLEKMMEIIDTLDMSEEERAELKASLSDKSGMLGNMAKGMGAQAAYNPWTAYGFFIVAVLVIVLILAFFGFKLYYSEAQKEKKREEKKKLKQQKKKK